MLRLNGETFHYNNQRKVIHNLLQVQVMQPETNTKRNIFRASLRKDFIESYQRSIRMKYLSLESQQSMDLDNDRLKLATQNVSAKLEQVLKLSSTQICKIDYFDFFVSCIETVAKKNTGGCDLSSKGNIQQNRPQTYMEENGYIFEEPRQSKSSYFSSQRKGQKISGVWVHKEKVYSLLYRILDKAFSQEKGQLWYVIDRALYLLQFPELMPLWEKLASTGDEKSKNYCCEEFCKKILKSSCISNLQSNIILDPDFVLDILTNFIVQAPCVSFDNMINLMPFISYSLRVSHQKTNQREDSESNYPILNKVCIIMRCILKQDSKQRMTRIVDSGYADIFVGLIQQTFDLLGYESNQNPHQMLATEEDFNYNERFFNSRTIEYRLQCGSSGYKPANLQIVAKTNLIKFLNRLFVSHPQIATFLFLKVRNPYFLYSLFHQFLNPIKMCAVEGRNEFHQLQIQEKYSSIILCDSHRNFLKTILTTIHTLLVTGSIVGYSFVLDFLRCQGITFLERCANQERAQNKFGKEIVNVMHGLDLEGDNFYGKLNEEEFYKFVRSQVELVCCFSIRFLEQKKKLSYSFSTVSISQLIQQRNCLIKQLKLTRNSLLNAYARATEPIIFERARDCLIESQCGQVLEEVGRLQDKMSDDQQLSTYSSQIFNICKNPKLYLQQQKSSRQTGRLEVAADDI